MPRAQEKNCTCVPHGRGSQINIYCTCTPTYSSLLCSQVGACDQFCSMNCEQNGRCHFQAKIGCLQHALSSPDAGAFIRGKKPSQWLLATQRRASSDHRGPHLSKNKLHVLNHRDLGVRLVQQYTQDIAQFIEELLFSRTVVYPLSLVTCCILCFTMAWTRSYGNRMTFFKWETN